MVKNCITAGCLIFDGTRILLVNHIDLRVWIHPGGHIDAGERTDMAALREAKEETGLDIRLVSCDSLPKGRVKNTIPTPFAIVYDKTIRYPEDGRYKDNVHNHTNFFYMAKASGRRKLRHDSEVRAARWFKINELKGLRTFRQYKEVYYSAFSEMKKRGL